MSFLVTPKNLGFVLLVLLIHCLRDLNAQWAVACAKWPKKASKLGATIYPEIVSFNFDNVSLKTAQTL